MTDKAQQPEYIITEEQLRNNADVLCLDDIMKIRSRPHPPAPDPITADEMGDMCDQVSEVADRAATLAVLKGVPNDLRMNGWAVAIHNDYRQNGEQHTFWLLTNKEGRYVKGEGLTDVEALEQIRESLRQQQEREQG